MKQFYSHPTAEVSEKAEIGKDTKIWHQSQIREGVKLGSNCIVGKGVYIDKDVKIGSNVKIQNYSCIYHGVSLEDGIFVGPNVILTNDKYPRAINPDGSLKSDSDWKVGEIIVRKGAAIGTGSIIITDVEIGEYALVGAGSVVTKNVPPHALVYGIPAKVRGYVCRCGNKVSNSSRKPKSYRCSDCKKNKVW